MPAEIISAPPPAKSDSAIAAEAARVEIPATSIAGPVTPHAPPRPGSARERTMKSLAERARPEGEVTPPPGMPPKKQTAAAPAEEAKPAVPEGAQEEPPPEKEGEAPEKPAAAPDKTKTAPEAAKVKEKVSPWKLVDDYKEQLKQTKARLAELEKSSPDLGRLKAAEEKLTATEAKLKSYEEQMRYLDYSSTDEFKDKYQKPYERAWVSAMKELKGLTVEEGESTRAFTAEDLLKLVSVDSLPKARQLAQEMFGEFADDVILHRNNIKKLFDDQAEALKEAKKTALQKVESDRRAQENIQKSILDEWSQINEQAKADPKIGQFFAEKEGDEEWNKALQKGYELVDRAWTETPSDPKLSAEDRKAIIRRHAALRNRAAAFGPLRLMIQRVTAELEEAKNKLKEYEESEPGTQGREAAPSTTAPASGSLRDRMKAELAKRAH